MMNEIQQYAVADALQKTKSVERDLAMLRLIKAIADFTDRLIDKSEQPSVAITK